MKNFFIQQIEPPKAAWNINKKKDVHHEKKQNINGDAASDAYHNSNNVCRVARQG